MVQSFTNLEKVPAFITLPQKITVESEVRHISYQTTAKKFGKIVGDPHFHDLTAFTMCSFKNHIRSEENINEVFGLTYIYENVSPETDIQVHLATKPKKIHYTSYFLNETTLVYVFTFPKKLKYEKYSEDFHYGFALKCGLPMNFHPDSWNPWVELPIVRDVKHPFALFSPTQFGRLNIEKIEQIVPIKREYETELDLFEE